MQWDSSAIGTEDTSVAFDTPVLNEFDFLQSFFNGENFDLLNNNLMSTGDLDVTGNNLDNLMYIKNEPSSPDSCYSDSLGDSSGPSSPETLIPSLDIPAISTIPMPLPIPMASSSNVDIKKRAGKRSRQASPAGTPPSTPLPSNVPVDEERQIKRQRRLIKNRESAQKSRLRKKMYIEDLENKVKAVNAQNEQLVQENNALKEEVNYLTRLIKKNPALSEELSNRQRAGVTSIRNGKAAGICLLIVLFSVGLFFDNVHNTGSTGLPFDINSPREPVPEVVPFGGGKRGLGRLLKSVRNANPSLSGLSNEDAVADLTEIYPSRRVPVEIDALEVHKQKKAGTSPYDSLKEPKIKLENDMDTDDEMDFSSSAYIPVTHLPNDEIGSDVASHLRDLSEAGNDVLEITEASGRVRQH